MLDEEAEECAEPGTEGDGLHLIHEGEARLEGALTPAGLFPFCGIVVGISV